VYSCVACFNKNKLHKKYQFGRAYQLGRLGGNFLIVGNNTSVRMEDKHSLQPMVEMHQTLFQTADVQIATDKGYYSKNNVTYLNKKTNCDTGLQRPEPL
jgi:IS5 family transposase